MFHRAPYHDQDQGGLRWPTASVVTYVVEDWPPCTNADIETEGTF